LTQPPIHEVMSPKVCLREEPERTAVPIPDHESYFRPPCVDGLSAALGCENDCRYCFVRNDALADGMTEREWRMPQKVDLAPVIAKASYKRDGPVQFPTTHDITPMILEDCIKVLRALLVAGNTVIIVTKPWRRCMKRMMKEFADYKDQLLFRFSITAGKDEILRLWECKAPRLKERLDCLHMAHAEGFQTGISIAPMLDIANVVELFHSLEPYVTDKIYLAKMAQGEKLSGEGSQAREDDIERIRRECGDKALLQSVVDQLKDNPKFAPKFCVDEYDPWADDWSGNHSLGIPTYERYERAVAEGLHKENVDW